MTLEFDFSGPSRRWSTDTPSRWRSKRRGVVAMLALHANSTLSGDDLIDGLWGDHPPASAAKNLQLYVSRLRRALAGGGPDAEIVTHGRGYELRLPERRGDALRFERLVGRRARRAGDRRGANSAPAPRSSSGAALRSPRSPRSRSPPASRPARGAPPAGDRARDRRRLATGRHDEVWRELRP